MDCRRCGRCCILKEAAGGLSKLTDSDCQFLIRHPDGKTSCSIYENKEKMRLNGENICVPISDALRFGDLPPDCPYAMATPGYKTKVINWVGMQCREPLSKQPIL